MANYGQPKALTGNQKLQPGCPWDNHCIFLNSYTGPGVLFIEKVWQQCENVVILNRPTSHKTPKRRLLSHVRSQMMKYFGHIARRGGDSLEKVIQGCIEGRRKPGRPRTRWIDQIKSMVGCPLHELYNLAQDRQRWCDVVAVASCQSWQDRTDRQTTKHLLSVVGMHGRVIIYSELLFCPHSLIDYV